MIDLVRITAGRREQPFHWHGELTLLLMLRGRACGILNNEGSSLAAGDIWLVNPEVIYGLEDCSEDAVWLQLALDLKKFEAYIPGISTEYFKCGPAEDSPALLDLKAEIRGRMCTIAGQLGNRSQSVQEEREVLYACLEILNNLKLGFILSAGSASREQSGENFNRYWRLLDYIYDHCNRKLTLKEAADSEHISEVYASKIMREVGGYGFSDTLALVRAECSIRYLLESDLNITRISEECGFSAPRYYNAAFRKYFSCSPREYREKIRSSAQHREHTGEGLFILRDGVTAGELSELLDAFRRDSYLAWEVIRAQIDPVHPGITKKQRENPYKKEILLCEEQDLMRFDRTAQLLACRQELHLRSVYLQSGEEAGQSSLIVKNLAYCGLQQAKACTSERGVELSALFDAYGRRTPLYYMTEIFNTAGLYYRLVKEGVFAWKAEAGDGTLHLLVFNDSTKKEKRFLLSFEQSPADRPYALQMTDFTVQTDAQTLALEAGLEDGLRQKLASPRQEVFLVSDLHAYQTEMCVGTHQAKRIDLIPVHDGA